MMGTAPPSQSTLSDLKVLLELLQAASDPKKAKAAIDSISEARKQYDDAITEANARITVALAAEKSAETAAAKAETAEAKLEKKQADIANQTAAMKDERESLEGDKQIFATYKAEIEAQAKVNAAERESLTQHHLLNMKAVKEAKDSFAKELDAFDVKVSAVNDLKAEYEDKLAKFKALTA